MSVRVLIMTVLIGATGLCHGCGLFARQLERLSHDRLDEKHTSVVVLRLRIRDETGWAKGFYQRINFIARNPGPRYLAIWDRETQWHQPDGVHTYDGLFVLRAEPGQYELFNFHLPFGTTHGYRSRTEHFYQVPIKRRFQVPPKRVVYLGRFDITLTRGSTRRIVSRTVHSLGDTAQARDLLALRTRFPQVTRQLPGEPVHAMIPKGPLWPLRSACLKGDAARCNQLGVAHSKGHQVARSHVAASQLFARACTLGYGMGCYNLGIHALGGHGMAKDAMAAARLFERACQLGQARGCNQLGRSLSLGRGIPQDLARAAALYQKACRLGHAIGCQNAAVMLHTGRGVAKDVRAAVQLYTTACEGRVPAACNSLGVQYATGKVVPRDLPRAVRLYQKACAGKNAWGCFNLAKHLEQGKGVAPDPSQARRLLQWACRQGHRKSCERLAPRPAPPAPTP